ncbi:MAG: hypothetical protein ACTS3R_16750 [Inquilinaceae bacterium]
MSDVLKLVSGGGRGESVFDTVLGHFEALRALEPPAFEALGTVERLVLLLELVNTADCLALHTYGHMMDPPPLAKKISATANEMIMRLEIEVANAEAATVRDLAAKLTFMARRERCGLGSEMIAEAREGQVSLIESMARDAARLAKT